MHRTLRTLSWTSFYTHMPSFSQPTSLDSESSECLHWHPPSHPYTRLILALFQTITLGPCLPYPLCLPGVSRLASQDT